MLHNSGLGRHDNAFADVRREIAIMKKLKHRNLVCLHEVIDDPASDSLRWAARKPRVSTTMPRRASSGGRETAPRAILIEMSRYLVLDYCEGGPLLEATGDARGVQTEPRHARLPARRHQ